MTRPQQETVGRRARLLTAAFLGLLLASAAFAVQPEGSRESTRWDEHTAAAREAEEAQDWEAALGHYRRALEVAERFESHDPRRLETLESLGELHRRRLNRRGLHVAVIDELRVAD